MQGTINSTQVSTDMAINGDGWFVVAQPTGFTDNQPTFSGVTDFTRAGNFQLNANGNLVNAAGYYLMGIPVNATTGNPEGSVPQVLQFNNNFIPAQATTSITYQANLPSAPTSGTMVPSDFANNPIAGAEIIGTGASLNPDAVATGTGTVGSLTNATTLSSLGIASGDKILIGDGTNTTTYTSTGTDTVGDLINAINSGSRRQRGGDCLAQRRQPGTHRQQRHRLDLGQRQRRQRRRRSRLRRLEQHVPADQPADAGIERENSDRVGRRRRAADHHLRHRRRSTSRRLAELQTAVQNLTGVIGSVNTANGDISLLATDPTATLAVAGTASPSTFGIQNANVAPGNGTVIGSDVTTFTNQSIDGGSITAYDTEGNPLNIQFRWAQVGNSSGESTWNLFYQTNSSATGTQAAWQNVGSNFIFNSSGQLVQPTSSVLTLPNLTVNGDTLSNVEINFGTNGLTQFANSSGTAQVTQIQQNGFAAGQLQSVSVDSENRVVGTFTNGQTIPLAQITLATFNGENSLQALNGGAYAATADSGPPIFGATGKIDGSSLESSNVDISTQFSNLIVAQQAYSANARVMTTANQMIQSLLQVIQ